MAPPAALHTEALTDTQATTIPQPTTVPSKTNTLYNRTRTADHAAASLKSWGVAAPCHSNQFRTPAPEGTPFAKRWDHLLTEESKARNGSSIKKAAKFLSKEGLISLGGGIPTSMYFPYEELTMSVPQVGVFSPSEVAAAEAEGKGENGLARLTAGKHDLAEGKSIFDISTAFNYGQGTGSAQLLRWVTEHTELVHRPPYADWAVNLNIGSTSGLDMSIRMLCNRGEVVLAEEYTFSAVVETTNPMGVKLEAVPMDGEGLNPQALDSVLSSWNPEVRGAKKPAVLYVIPTGQNPTGATMSLQRRKDVYAVCQKHNVFILEDEPYYFLQMSDYVSKVDAAANGIAVHQEDDPRTQTHEAFLKNLVPSFLSLDVDGRVLRMDSFSKVISPGSRIGWVTASEQIINRYHMHVDCSTQGPAGISQLVLFKLLEEHWGHSGYLDWLKYIRSEYTVRRDNIVASCEKHLPRDIVSWVPPKAGMFQWMQIDWRKHPESSTKSLLEIEDQIFMESIEHGALVMKGSFFVADAAMEQEKMFFRATFAAAPGDKIDAAIARFGDAIRAQFGLEKEQNDA